MRPSVEESFVRSVARLGLVHGGDRVLAAVSGGGDSVLMLHLLIRHRSRLPFGLHVAHLNHALRGAESDADETFVRELAARHALPFTSARVDLARRPGGPSSLEERARVARHAFLARTAAETGCNRISLGHTLDDQAETILMWLLRGAGRGGLSGMEPMTGEGRIRPLLSIRREEVRAYLRESAIPWRDDLTNEDGARLRNRIRLRLVPLLEEEFGGSIEAIAGAASLLAAEESYLDEAARGLLDPTTSALPAARAAASSPALARRAIRLAAEAAGLEARSLERDHVEAIAGLLREAPEGKGLDLPGDYRAERRGDHVVFLRRPERREARGR